MVGLFETDRVSREMMFVKQCQCIVYDRLAQSMKLIKTQDCLVIIGHG